MGFFRTEFDEIRNGLLLPQTRIAAFVVENDQNIEQSFDAEALLFSHQRSPQEEGLQPLEAVLTGSTLHGGAHASLTHSILPSESETTRNVEINRA